MQSIARDSEDSTDDEFFDAHGKVISFGVTHNGQCSEHIRNSGGLILFQTCTICFRELVLNYDSLVPPAAFWFSIISADSFIISTCMYV